MKKSFLNSLNGIDFKNLINSGIKGFTRGAVVFSAISILGGFASRDPLFTFAGLTIMSGSILVSWIIVYFAIGGGLFTAFVAMIIAYIDNQAINNYINSAGRDGNENTE